MIAQKHARGAAASESAREPLARLREYYKSSEGYRSHLEAKGPSYFAQFAHVVCECSSPSDRILDLGCGTGESTREIARQNRIVIGADLSSLFLHTDAATGLGTPHLLASDASCLPFEDQTFDVVCAMEFVEHVWPVEPVLTEIDRVLKPLGRVVLISPNLLSPLWPVRDLPAMLRGKFRPPLYNSYRSAVGFFARSLVVSTRKMLSQDPHFISREPDLPRADAGGDFDSVYASNARDLTLFFRRVGYKVEFAASPRTSFRSRIGGILATTFGSAWTSFLLRATKVARPNMNTSM